MDIGAHQMRDLKIFLENGRVGRRESCSLESLSYKGARRSGEPMTCLKSGEEVRLAKDREHHSSP